MALMKVASFSAIADLASGLLANSSSASDSTWRAWGGCVERVTQALDEHDVQLHHYCLLFRLVLWEATYLWHYLIYTHDASMRARVLMVELTTDFFLGFTRDLRLFPFLAHDRQSTAIAWSVPGPSWKKEPTQGECKLGHNFSNLTH